MMTLGGGTFRIDRTMFLNAPKTPKVYHNKNNQYTGLESWCMRVWNGLVEPDPLQALTIKEIRILKQTAICFEICHKRETATPNMIRRDR